MSAEFVFCSKCGFQNTKKNNFCSRCGEKLRTTASFAAHRPQRVAGPDAGEAAPVPGKCGNCGHVNDPAAEFCQGCSMPMSPDVTVDNQGDLIYIKLNMEELDFDTHSILAPVFKAIMRKKIIMDVSDVKWMDSTGIGTLVSQVYRFTRTKQEMKIVGMNKKIFNAVKQLQVDNVLELCDTINDARVSWGLPPS
jgi:anti-anti-sigma factor